MPIYDYCCEKCGHEFEREQRITEDPIRRCPKCRSLRAKRLISRTSFVLKGGGWYKDLYSSPRPGSSKGETSGAKSESKPDGGSDGKAGKESKPSESGSSKPKTTGSKAA